MKYLDFVEDEGVVADGVATGSGWPAAGSFANSARRSSKSISTASTTDLDVNS